MLEFERQSYSSDSLTVGFALLFENGNEDDMEFNNTHEDDQEISDECLDGFHVIGLDDL